LKLFNGFSVQFGVPQFPHKGKDTDAFVE